MSLSAATLPATSVRARFKVGRVLRRQRHDALEQLTLASSGDIARNDHRSSSTQVNRSGLR